MRRILYFLVALALAALMLRPALADSLFQVTEPVTGMGTSASEAYRHAVDTGRRKAWETLVQRLTTQDQWAKLVAIDEVSLQRMVKSYLPEHERRSTTRYAADMTYVFNEPLVRHYLHTSDVVIAMGGAQPMLVVPMAPGYAPDTPWGRAWATISLAAGTIPVVLPVADPLNRTALGSIDFATAAWSDLAPVAARAHAGEAAVVQAGPGRPGHLAVGIRILADGQPAQALTPLDVPVPPRATPEQGYALAAQAAADAIGNAWKAHNAIDFSKPSALTVNVAIRALADWGAMQQRLAKIPAVIAVKVDALMIGQVQADLSYAGTQAQLADFLAQAGLTLQNQNGQWWLTSAAVTAGEPAHF